MAANTTGSMVVQIATGQHSFSAQSVAPHSRISGLRILPMLCGLILAPLAWRARRRALLLAVLLVSQLLE